jgi:hypothetical protein
MKNEEGKIFYLVTLNRGTRRLVYDALRCGLQRLVNQFADRGVQPKIGTYLYSLKRY